MLDARSSRLAHGIQNLLLIALSLALLPLNTLLLAISLRRSRSKEELHLRQRRIKRADTEFQPKKILVTGIGMTKGLALARLFYQAGHDVVGADFMPGNALPCGLVSKAVGKFHRLDAPSPASGSAPYVESLLSIINEEDIDLWVSCSGVASAVEDGIAKQVIEARTKCKAIQFDAKTTQILHEKHSFIERTKELDLTVPETYEITSVWEVERILSGSPKGRKYIMKTIGVDDSVRADMTLLPKPSRVATSRHIEKLKISETTPWILQQFIDGREFCTHSLVIRGEVRAFVACPSAELLMYYEALPADSPLVKAMLSFTRTFAERSGPDFTGHLSFDFLAEHGDLLKQKPEEITLYPIECNPRAHTAVALFNGMTDMADAYLSVLEPCPKPSYADVVNPSRRILAPKSAKQYYWIGHDMVTLLIIPLVQLLLFRISPLSFVQNLDTLVDHFLYWSDGTFADWDPFPFWWLYQIYWPFRFWAMFWNGCKWSRINVSTGKMFVC